MEEYIILESSRDPKGSYFSVILSGDKYFLVLFDEEGKTIRRRSHSDLKEALVDFGKEISIHNLELITDTFLIPVGYIFCVQTEYRDCAREVIRIFYTQEAFDLFRHEQLAVYAGPDRDEIDRLLEAGELDTAWETAVADDGDRKNARFSPFGDHYVSLQPNFAAYSQLPDWLRPDLSAFILKK